MNNDISHVHKEILDEKRQVVFSLLERNFPKFVLAGETAIALQIKHRKSYDFDFFLADPVSKKLLNKINGLFSAYQVRPVVDTSDELSVILDGEIKLSFIYFPFPALHEYVGDETMRLFDVRDLASNKAYAIGRRGVWRDYVDVFFLLKNSLKFEEILLETKQRFGGNFDEKLFLQQLVYFADLGAFEVDWIDEKISQTEIESFFVQLVTDFVSAKTSL